MQDPRSWYGACEQHEQFDYCLCDRRLRLDNVLDGGVLEIYVDGLRTLCQVNTRAAGNRLTPALYEERVA